MMLANDNDNDIVLRRACALDSKNIFLWRNNEFTRQYSADTSIIDWQTHEKWFEKIISGNDRVLLIGSIKGQEIGVLRYDLQPTLAIISVYLVPLQYGKGLGTRLICTGNEWVRKYLPFIEKIHAMILPNNLASHNAFKKAGFIKDSSGYYFDLRKHT